MAGAETMEWLAGEWQRLMDEAGAANGSARHEVFALLVNAYSEPHRHYHNLDHIASMLYALIDVSGWLQRPFVVQFATFFHDVVYDTTRNDNEDRSAEVATAALASLGIATEYCIAVDHLIRLTKSHDTAAGESDGGWFLDADLEVFAWDWDAYKMRYSAAIRKEYAWVDAPVYYPKRREVLESFLDRPMIYHTERNRQSLEAKARSNLTREIAQIKVFW